MKRKLPTAPSHLSTESKRFWQQSVEDYHLESHHLQILQSACEAWDRILEARQQMEKTVRFTKTDGSSHKSILRQKRNVITG